MDPNIQKRLFVIHINGCLNVCKWLKRSYYVLLDFTRCCARLLDVMALFAGGHI
jgi:hypothetical protein